MIDAREGVRERNSAGPRLLGLHFLTDSGQIVITTVADLDVYEAETLRILNQPSDILIVRMGEDLHGVHADLVLPPALSPEDAAAAVCRKLREEDLVEGEGAGA